MFLQTCSYTGAETWMWREQVIVSRRVEEGVKGKYSRPRKSRAEGREEEEEEGMNTFEE